MDNSCSFAPAMMAMFFYYLVANHNENFSKKLSKRFGL